MSHVRLKPLAEQVVVITGASSGIGLATARLVARRGAAVVLVARNCDVLRRIAEEIEAEGGRAAFAVADVGDADQVEAAAAYAVNRFGRIDSWVNNAGVALYARLADTPAADHERLFRTNYWGVVNGSLTALRHLRTGGGAIVNIGSIGSDSPSPLLSAYAVTKAAVKRFTRSLQEELYVDRVPVAVTLVRPSGVNTPLADHAAAHMDGSPRLPPYTYDPAVVAKAILDALQHHRGEMIVGGTGRLIVPLSHLFPRLRLLLAAPLARRFEDRSRRPSGSSNLYAPLGDARESTSGLPARRSSFTTAAARRPLLTAGALLASLAVVIALRAGRKDG